MTNALPDPSATLAVPTTRTRRETPLSYLKAEAVEVRLFSTVQDLPASSWKEAAREAGICLQVPYLRALEDSKPLAMQFRYALFFKGRKPVAAATFQILDSHAITNESKNRRVVGNRAGVLLRQGFDQLIAHLGRRLIRRQIVCGNVFSSGPSGFTYTQDLSPKRAFECLQQAVQRLYELDRGSSPIDAILLKDLQRPTTTGLQVMTSKFYTLFRVDPIMVMNLPPHWTLFEDYLAELKSNYRRHAKKALRAGSKLKHQDLSVEQIEAEKKAIFALFHAVFKRAHFRFGCLSDDYFVHLKAQLQGQMNLRAYYLENRMVAFTANLIDGNVLQQHYVGLDYDSGLDMLLKHILLDTVRMAIDGGVRRIVFGRTASELKSSLGAQPLDVELLFRHRSPVPNWFLSELQRFIQPASWTPRHAFRFSIDGSSGHS